MIDHKLTPMSSPYYDNIVVLPLFEKSLQEIEAEDKKELNFTKAYSVLSTLWHINTISFLSGLGQNLNNATALISNDHFFVYLPWKVQYKEW